MTKCKHVQLLDMDLKPVFCEECGGKICDKCGRCFDCGEVYLTRPTSRQLAAQKRFRCECGLFVKKPTGVFPGEDRVVCCTQGHSVTYHEPAIYFVQAFHDPVTHIIGDDTNRGLSAMEPLRTLTEAMKRCKPHDSVILPRREE